MKNVFRRLLPLMVAPLLASCSFGTTKILKQDLTTIMSTSNMTSTEIYLSCQKANGYIIYQILLSENTANKITADVKVNSGTVTFTVSTMEDRELYSQPLTSDNVFTMNLFDLGNFKVRIDHEDFKGSYKLNWAKEK